MMAAGAFLLAILGLWAGGATWLLLAGNRLAEAAVSRSFELQDFYEQQGAEFRRAIAASKAEYQRARREAEDLEKLAQARVGVEGRLAELTRRQSQLEARQSALLRLAEQVSGTPAAVLAAAAPARKGASAGEKTRSLSGATGEEEAPVDLDPDAALLAGEGALPPDTGADPGPARTLSAPGADPGAAAELLARRMAALEGGMEQGVRSLDSRAAERAGLLAQAAETAGRELADIVEPARLKAARAVVALARPAVEDASPFGLALARLRQNLGTIRRLAPVVDRLPLRQPVSLETRVTSAFGVRSDPFLGTQRFHAGQDFAAGIGAPVYATGGGLVLSAGASGGYGNLVQVDHGKGLVTRYAHLSEIHVSAGQPVAAGQLLGRAGSSGRSTGPHLHYETRLNDVPNDPMRLLRVGAQLGYSASALWAGTQALPPARPAPAPPAAAPSAAPAAAPPAPRLPNDGIRFTP